MGLFNHLFKNKSPQGDERMEEGRQPSPLEGAAETPAAPKPDLTVFLHPKAYVPRGGGSPVLPGGRQTSFTGGKASERKGGMPAPPVAGEIVLTLGDVLSRIPTQLLKSGPHDAKRELRFKIGDLSSDIARGRAVVPLSRIAALCPDIFQKEVTAAEDMDVRLPLQKLVEQIGLMRSNPPAPLPEIAPRPIPSEASPSLLPTRVPLAMRTPALPPRQSPKPRLSGSRRRRARCCRTRRRKSRRLSRRIFSRRNPRRCGGFRRRAGLASRRSRILRIPAPKRERRSKGNPNRQWRNPGM